MAGEFGGKSLGLNEEREGKKRGRERIRGISPRFCGDGRDLAVGPGLGDRARELGGQDARWSPCAVNVARPRQYVLGEAEWALRGRERGERGEAAQEEGKILWFSFYKIIF